MAVRYPKEIHDFIREHAAGRTSAELAELVNERFGTEFTVSKIKSYKTNHKLKSGIRPGNPKGYSPVYPKGMEHYMRSIAAGRTAGEIAEAVSGHFGIEFSVSQCKAYKRNHGIISGLDCRFKKGEEPANKGKKMSPELYEKCKETMFRKGNVPVNRMEVGEYTHTTDGYLVQKVQEQGRQCERFEFVHRAVWEKHYGPIPKGKKISFLDGNKDNCSIENLVLLDGRENLEMNRSSLRFSQPELTQAGVNLARMKIAVQERKRRCTKAGCSRKGEGIPDSAGL